MSHFVVMVIGPNVEEQLAPFDESKEVDEYRSKVLTDEDKQFMVDYYVEMYPALAGKSFEEVYAERGNDWNGGRYRKDENGVWGEYSTYNPDSKWDWYTLGGRYSGWVTLKPGAEGVQGEPGVFGNATGIDKFRKKDVDVEGARAEARKDAEAAYDKFAKAIKGHPWPETWEELEKRLGAGPGFIRAAYQEQPGVKALREAKVYYSHEHFGQDRAAFVEKQVRAAMVPFAFVKDGTWCEKGKMGWWACVSDEKDPGEWQEQFWTMFNALPDDTEISIIDCHI